MQTNTEILELFPIPVMVNHIPEELSKIVPWFYTNEMLGSEEVDTQNYGQRSKNSYILDEPECKDLGNYILNLTNQFADQLGYKYNSYRFSQSWISVKQPNQHHQRHVHPNSIISGVLFFGESSKETPAISFHPAEVAINLPYIDIDKERNNPNKKYSWTGFSINFEPGLLLLFPSHLHHQVPINTTNKPRYSLAFNIVPTQGLGVEANLTELKYQK